MPFIGVLVAPEFVFNYPIIANIAKSWDLVSADQLVLPITVTFIFAAAIAGIIRVLLLWGNTRLSVSTGADLSIEAYRRTLCQPYHVHLARNSSEVISGIVNKVNAVVFGVLLPILTLISSTVLLVAIMLTLITIDPFVALVAGVCFGASYAFITLMSRRWLHSNSKRIAHEQNQVIKALQEGLGGIRDVLLDGTQPVYCEIYRQSDYPLRRMQGNNVFIGQSPRFIMEALGMILIAALAYILSFQAGGIAMALPVLGAMAVGAQRLLPAVQQIYGSWANIAGNKASLIDALELLDQPLPVETTQTTSAILKFKDNIRYSDVRFRYTNDGPWVLDGINLRIQKGARVGFVGSTGSGKSTTLDLLMGLLMPTEGKLLVDGQQISNNCVRSWQRNIAHVPQSIYLADSTLAENIAFGVANEDIDMDLVQKVARQAQISDFIESNPGGYQAYVGERGIRLSGGQRQRIGIARALYKQATVLILDEATRALDSDTEKSVMEAIEGLNRDLTILLIAHRITTVKSCDVIVELQNGVIVDQGTYEQLLETSSSFKNMARLVD